MIKKNEEYLCCRVDKTLCRMKFHTIPFRGLIINMAIKNLVWNRDGTDIFFSSLTGYWISVFLPDIRFLISPLFGQIVRFLHLKPFFSI